jgi:hypothetical protein
MRNVFIVVAGGNAAAERHFEDTIQNKRRLDEIRRFLPEKEAKSLEEIYHGSPFIVWGAVPGRLNETRWNVMNPGDVVLICNRGRIRFAGEVGAKARSKDLAKFFWRENPSGETWELIYFILNEEKVNVPLSKLNPLFGYAENYFPRGFTMINKEAVTNFARNYGDILSVLKTLERNEELILIPHEAMERRVVVVHEKIEKAPTDHTEMQWRLIQLGQFAKFDIWIPKSDQGKEYEGHQFRNFVLPEFHEVLDVPPTVKNIDVVWRFGPYSIKSAFEIESTTAVYSGILRLSDLRAESPNSNYPLFIVAPEEKKRRVFEELKRPTFSSVGLRLNEIVRYLGYKHIREVSESVKRTKQFNPVELFNLAESV